MDELISIIVPIYNVEEYLRECLDSIQKQTYPNFECIMVNDGSTDNSKQIAEEYLVDSRFRLINQSNQGLSGARNTGISRVREESTFVAFVDSDDYVYPNFLETLVEYIEEDVDIIEGMVEHYHNGNIYYFPQVEHYKVILETVSEKLEKLALERIRNGVFPKLIRRELLNDNFFPKGWLFEDLAVVPELVTNSTKWVKIQETVYTYRIRDNSIITSSFSEKDLVIFKIFEKFDFFFKDESLDIKIWVEKLKLLHINYRSQKVPNQYIERYQKEKERILSNIEEYEKGELISIIVPIYNSENYLRQCLDSIMGQTYKNFECLLINDGSPDHSADICREYVSKDSRFLYFEKENGGVSSARNLGIERSKGEYITFIDSDDWVDSDYLEVLYTTLLEEGADITVSTYKRFNIKDSCFYFHIFQRGYDKKTFTGQELIASLQALSSFDRSYISSSNKLVKSRQLKTIRFNEKTTLGEDMEFWYKLYLISDKIVYVNKDTYIYRTSNDEYKHFELEKIRSDIQHRLNFIAFLTARKLEVSSYVDDCVLYLHDLVDKMKLEGLEFTQTARWLQEVLFLLEG
ncbi:glycosyltransferase family 2 protein [Streptococcus mitis]|uniref:glycosyltransferase family 2 protein n=1 Tax=Streptococcus mitis TaxID=28037 RepID=UPI0021B543E1|nr:glycosyltransferase [Streptococcus mitis]